MNEGLVQAFLGHIKPLRAEATIKRYRRVLLELSLAFVLLRVTPEQAKAFVHRRGLSPRTCIQRFAVLKAFYEWAVLEEKLLTSPMEKLDYPKVPKLLPKNVMSPGETQKLLASVSLETEDHRVLRNRVVMELLYSCSLRRSEIVSLDLNDFDGDDESLKVKAGKTRVGRRVPVGARVTELLNKYINQFRPEAKHLGIFVADKGGRLKADWVTKMVTAQRQKAGIRTKATSHSFRKSSATHMLKNGAGLTSVQALLGHAVMTSTEVYTKVYPKDLFRIHKAHHPREKQKNPDLPELEVPKLHFRRK